MLNKITIVVNFCFQLLWFLCATIVYVIYNPQRSLASAGGANFAQDACIVDSWSRCCAVHAHGLHVMGSRRSIASKLRSQHI